MSCSCQRRHWCSHCCAFGPAYCCPLCRPGSPCCDTVSIHSTLFRSHSFTYIFTVFSRHFKCGIYIPLDSGDLFLLSGFHVRGVLLAKGPDSSFAEAQREFISELTRIKDEVKDQENEVEDGRDCEECKVESRREVKHCA